MSLVDKVDHLYAIKGKKVVHFNFKESRPDDKTLKKLILGPTGNLRAPTLRKGKTLIVGFDDVTYETVFG